MQVYNNVLTKKNHTYFCLFGVCLVAVQIHTLKQKFCMVKFLVVRLEVLSGTCVGGILIMRQNSVCSDFSVSILRFLQCVVRSVSRIATQNWTLQKFGPYI